MPSDHPAFRAGEPVRMAPLAVLQEIQEKDGKDGPQGRLMIHDILVSDFCRYPEKQVRIKDVSIYHMGTVLYEFHEIEGLWLEQTIVDPLLFEQSEGPLSERADAWYEVSCEETEDGSGIVHIWGKQDDLLYYSARKQQVSRVTEAVAKVATLRSKICFEYRYGFDGSYDEPPVTSS